MIAADVALTPVEIFSTSLLRIFSLKSVIITEASEIVILPENGYTKDNGRISLFLGR